MNYLQYLRVIIFVCFKYFLCLSKKSLNVFQRRETGKLNTYLISSKAHTLATWYLRIHRLCFWANWLILNHASYITPVNQITACKIKKLISIFVCNMHQTDSRRSVGVPSEA